MCLSDVWNGNEFYKFKYILLLSFFILSISFLLYILYCVNFLFVMSLSLYFVLCILLISSLYIDVGRVFSSFVMVDFTNLNYLMLRLSAKTYCFIAMMDNGCHT
jgi:hypothetical protein